MLYFSFDAETDGLYGEVFAIAAIVAGDNGEIVDSFLLKCVEPGVSDPWTREYCLPNLADIPSCESRAELRQRFWSFYMRWRDRCVAVADVPCPVEAGLLRACVEEDEENRRFLAPYPLIDVASVLFAHGVDPHIDRFEFSGHEGSKHNPLDDMIASAKCLLKVLNKR